MNLETAKITAMHNLYANFVKILEECKHFSQNLVNDKGKSQKVSARFCWICNLAGLCTGSPIATMSVAKLSVNNILLNARLLLQQHEQFVADGVWHDDAAPLDTAFPAQKVGRLQGVEHVAPLLQLGLAVFIGTAPTVVVQLLIVIVGDVT